MPEEEFDETHFDRGSRQSRAERKRISRTDRSKFKKTDWDKRPLARSAAKVGETQGQVVRAMGDIYYVQVSNERELISCSLRGALKKENTQSKNLVVVGDRVLISRSGATDGAINAVLERKSALLRADNLSRRKRHLMAANIDWAIIVGSVVSPLLKPPLLDRCLIAAQKGGMKPLIALNKVDLLDQPGAKSERALADELAAIYRSLAIPMVFLSAKEQTGTRQLAEMIGAESAAIAGQSGVGKTSIINALTGLSLPVGAVRVQTSKGTHTTTHASLISLPGGGWLIDTPGVRSFGVWQLETQELTSYFAEIANAGADCRFTSCTHVCEEGCAIPRAIEVGTISPLRYASYAALLGELNQQHLRR